MSTPVTTTTSSTTTTAGGATNTSPLVEECCKPGSTTSYPSNLSFPGGKEVEIGGIPCYSVNDASKNVVIMSVDVFGYRFANSRQNADQIAAGGFHVVIPDLFNGNDVGPNEIQQKGTQWLFQEWFPANQQTKTAERTIAVAQALKKDKNVASIQAIGYCYGTVGVLQLARKGLISAAVLGHPTGFTKDNVSELTVPALFLCAEQDQAFTPELRQHWQTTLQDKMQPAKFVDYPGTQHGFAVRDDGSPVGVAARQAALEESVAFFKQGAVV